MLNQLKLFFDDHLRLSAPEESSEEKLQLSCAALFLEMMMMDEVVEAKEQDVILELMRNNFSLSTEQATTLIELAELQRKQATDYFQFTSLINNHYSDEQKISLIESLWKVAFVDGVLDMHEEYLVRKISDLLHISHTDFIKAKNRMCRSE
jgi:uncharacterized tellurite resistance protein B-like protein